MAQKTKALEKNTELPISIVDYFFPINEKKDTINDSPLVKVSRVLQSRGISKSHLREALAVLIGIMSSRLGDPVPIVITEDEGAGAVEFLDTCLSLVPEDSWIELSHENKKIAAENNLSKGKTIISYDADSIKNELMKILVGTERGHKINLKKKLDGTTNSHPLSFVVLTRNHNNPILQNRYITRIHLTADQSSKVDRLASMAKQSDLNLLNQIEIESACVRTLFERTKAVPVSIDFADKIMNKNAEKIQNIVPVYDLTLRVMRNITRINNAPPLRPYEQQAMFIGLNYDKLFPADQGNELEPIPATKVDYFYFKLIFEGLLRSVNDFITARQQRVFNGILKFHIECLEKYRKKYKTDFELLNYLHASGLVSPWAARPEIYKNVMSDGGEEFSPSTLNIELQALMKRNMVLEKKKGKSSKKLIYAVTPILYNSLIATAEASVIVDPIFKKSPVEVKDVITLKTVKI